MYGCIEIKDIDNQKKECEIGYWQSEEVTGKGIMNRSCKRVVEYAFNSLNMKKIHMLIAIENYKSQRIPEKLGFKKEEKLKEHECIQGMYLDNFRYTIKKEDFMENIIKEPNSWKDSKLHFMEVLNNPWYKQLVLLENLVTQETVKFYEQKGLITMHLPITTGSISSPMGKGSDSKPVKVNLEGIDTYLADSMQFLLEYGCRIFEKGCYYIMPSFRGEEADERHLCQFYHSEAEITGDLKDVMELVEEYVIYLAKKIIEKMGQSLKTTVGDISHIENIANCKEGFTKKTFDEVEKILVDKYKENIGEYIEVCDGFRNLSRKAEKALIEIFDGIVWVTNYDKLAVPFYQKLDENNNKTAKNADLLMGIGETVGCGQRHNTYAELKKSLETHEVEENEYEWYMEMKDKKPLTTSGFGMGIERFLMWVLKADDIRNMQICLRFNGENILP